MDSLKSLLDKKQFDLILKLTEGSEDANNLFYRISAFIYLGKYEDALFVIQDHQTTLIEKNLASLINAHINLLCILGRFDQAYSTLDYYANLPYQSQEVEEVLRKMPELIKLEENKQTTFRYYDDEQIEKFLKSEKREEVLMALDTIRSRDVLSFLPVLQDLLINHKEQLVRSFTLMLLVQKEVDRNLKMKSDGEMIDVNPKHLNPPFTGAHFNETLKCIDSISKDPSLSQNATQLFSEYFMYMYPRDLKCSPKEYAFVFYLLAREYAANPIENLDELLTLHQLDKVRIENLKKEVEERINSL